MLKKKEKELVFNKMNNYSKEQKEKICNLVYQWMKENNCHDSEQAHQNDECIINAINLIGDLADVVGIPYK